MVQMFIMGAKNLNHPCGGFNFVFLDNHGSTMSQRVARRARTQVRGNKCRAGATHRACPAARATL